MSGYHNPVKSVNERLMRQIRTIFKNGLIKNQKNTVLNEFHFIYFILQQFIQEYMRECYL